jgi:PhzF family phenazine biosynthesis protein
VNIPVYQVDAFASELFAGNPAAVCLLDRWLEDQILQSISTENNHSETAFLVQSGPGFEIRWFTPAAEVALCGHATLAGSFIIFNYLHWTEEVVRLQTRQSGLLTVRRKAELIEMDLPARPPAGIKTPQRLGDILKCQPLEVYTSVEDLLVLLADERAVRELEPDLALLKQNDQRGLIVTARGEDCDFVSRFFAPQLGIPEDPVTGSAHCVLTPYWAARLGKKQLHARQLSRRGGELFCEDRGERVAVAGKAVLYLTGNITIP